MSTFADGSDSLLIEAISERLGFDMVLNRLGIESDYSPFLYVGVFVIVNIVVGQIVFFYQTETVGILQNPFGLALPFGVVLAAIGIKYMTDARKQAVENLLSRNQVNGDGAAIQRTFSLRTKTGVYVFLVAGYLVYEITVVGINTILESQGIVLGIFYNLIIIPIGFLPVGVEFVMIYVAVQILLPRQLARQNLDLFFLDTRDMGGFQPIGELLKQSYYVYTAGLVLYLAFFYGPVVVPGVTPDTAVQTGSETAAIFTVLWGIGLATLSYSIYVTHKIMAAEKAKRLDEIEKRWPTAISNPHDISSAKIDDPDELETIQFRLEQVRNTSEYPTTFTMWVQIGISVLLPQLLQMTIQVV